MSFIKLMPRARVARNELKISFTGSKVIYANIHFSKQMLEKLSWLDVSRVCVYFDEENSKKLMLEKTSLDDKTGFVFPIKKDKQLIIKNAKLQFKFCKFNLETDSKKIRDIDYVIKDGKLFIEF